MLDGNDSIDQEEPELSQTPLKAGVDKHFILNLFKFRFINPHLSQLARRQLQAAKLVLPSFQTLCQAVKHLPIIKNQRPRKHR